MNLLITGGAGFIGSNFILYKLKQSQNIRIINLDKLTYAGNLENLNGIWNDPRHIFIEGDICDRELVETVMRKYNIEGVIHFAAESHVDQSISNPLDFVQTNVMGTCSLLEAARNYWMSDIGVYKPAYHHARFHHISTDEVFGTLGHQGYFTEDSIFAPNSPYSASKASSDMLVRSYYQTYRMNVVTTNCSNNFGPHQHDEKLIPTIIRRALALEEIPIYGNGENVRDWLFVLDHCRAIDKVYQEGKSGETYLIGGQNEKSNIEVASLICNFLNQIIPTNNKGIDNYQDLIKFVSDRPGHDFRYAVNDYKLRRELGFLNNYNFEVALKKTIKFYIEKYYSKNLIKYS